MILFELFKEFFKIGSLSIGGGYATLPFLYYIADKYQWYSIEELSRIIAIGSITPGPVGVNMATYAGLKTGGILGSVVATLSLVLPAYILVVITAKFVQKYKNNRYTQSILFSLKPAGCALLFAVAVKLIHSTVNNIVGVCVFVPLLIVLIKYKKSPIFFIITSGLVGLFMCIQFEIQ